MIYKRRVIKIIKSDFELIVHKLPDNIPYINVYPIGDVHVGSAEFDERQWETWVTHVLNDPYGYIVITGDMLNCAFKNSKSDVYADILSPQEQKEWLIEHLQPVKHRILGMCSGNHVQRATRELGYYPMYDIARELGIKNVYRENLMVIKVNYGRRNAERQHCCCICGHHGSTKNKLEKFELAVDNIDLFVTGHTHDPMFKSPAKICVDLHNENIIIRTFRSIVVNSFLKYGGYGVEKMYLPKCTEGIQYATFKGGSKRAELHWL